MKVTKLTPRGFCKGVVNAIHIINKALEDENLKRPFYMLGNIVHNKNIVNAFKEKGVIILDGPSRVKMLENITSGTVIFTAHGVSDKVRKISEAKGLDIIDATCKDVRRTHDLIKDFIDLGYTVLFYGKQNHPETEGVLGISPKIILIEDYFDLDSLPNINNQMIITNQTTMSYLNLITVYEKLLTKYPQLELMDEICSATRRRQEAVINAKNFDLIIVVGDKLSNNTKMLANLAKEKTNAIQVETLNDLKEYNLKDYKNIAITAGASTPMIILDEIVDAIEENNTFISKLTVKDFL